ncbi:MAG: hypothetical protein KDJ52_28210 [Anaerolineae bacterium]|nr:hypothetical protein [Anaerolineae bacterium]
MIGPFYAQQQAITVVILPFCALTLLIDCPPFRQRRQKKQFINISLSIFGQPVIHNTGFTLAMAKATRQ